MGLWTTLPVAWDLNFEELLWDKYESKLLTRNRETPTNLRDKHTDATQK
jgi:hypothetical protein